MKTNYKIIISLLLILILIWVGYRTFLKSDKINSPISNTLVTQNNAPTSESDQITYKNDFYNLEFNYLQNKYSVNDYTKSLSDAKRIEIIPKKHYLEFGPIFNLETASVDPATFIKNVSEYTKTEKQINGQNWIKYGPVLDGYWEEERDYYFYTVKDNLVYIVRFSKYGEEEKDFENILNTIKFLK